MAGSLSILLVLWISFGLSLASTELKFRPLVRSRVGDIIHVPCKPCDCFYEGRDFRIIANCTARNLTDIPSSVPDAAKEIGMRDNYLSNLSRSMFSRFPDLEKLDLALNTIESVEQGTFSGNGKLLRLDMQGNKLQLSLTVYKPGIFDGLQNLKTLKLNNNTRPTKENQLPGPAFRNLVSLEELAIDGFPGMAFGPDFAALSKLQTLNISGIDGHCFLNSLKNETFEHVPHVRILNLTYCNLTEAEANTFAPLKNLFALDLSDNQDFGFDNLGKAAYGLQNLPTEILKVNFIYRRFATCVMLRPEHLKYLHNTRLREIHMDGDRLEVFENGTLRLLPETLTKVSARYNRLTFGPYLFDLRYLKNLRHIDLSDEGVNYRIPSFPKEVVEACLRPENDQCDHDIEASLSPSPRQYGARVERPHVIIVYPVPPNLTSIKFTWKKMYYHLDEFGLTRNNLQDLDLSRNILSEWHGPLWGMDKVVNLDLSSNFAHFINEDFFANFSSLRVLNISNNFFYKTLASKASGKIFSHLPSLEVLDVSRNHLTHIHEDMMEGLHSLREFQCSNNKIQADYLNVSIAPAQNLTLLDFSENMLETFPRHLRDSLDVLTARNRTVQLDISNNIFSCDCGNLDFLYWLRSTKVTLLNRNEFSCKYPNGTYQSMRDLDAVITQVEHSCTSQVELLVGTSIASLVVILIIVALIAYRFRWKLYYMYYVARNQARAVEAEGQEEENYQYDAFISFAIEDREFVHEQLRVKLEQEKGIRLCLHYRDFTLGRKIADNIVECVQNSRRTVCILTPAFLESSWCKFEFEMARMESIHKGRDVVLFVLKDHVVSRVLPRDILYYIKTESYVEFPRDPRCVGFFWDNLVKALKTPASAV